MLARINSAVRSDGSLKLLGPGGVDMVQAVEYETPRGCKTRAVENWSPQLNATRLFEINGSSISGVIGWVVFGSSSLLVGESDVVIVAEKALKEVLHSSSSSSDSLCDPLNL